MPRSTVRQKACSAPSPFSGDSRGLRGSPDAVGSPYSCENGLNGGSPQELLCAPPTHFSHPRPHLQAGPQPQVYLCCKRKGWWRICSTSLKTNHLTEHQRMFYLLTIQSVQKICFEKQKEAIKVSVLNATFETICFS